MSNEDKTKLVAVNCRLNFNMQLYVFFNLANLKKNIAIRAF